MMLATESTEGTDHEDREALRVLREGIRSEAVLEKYPEANRRWFLRAIDRVVTGRIRLTPAARRSAIHMIEQIEE